MALGKQSFVLLSLTVSLLHWSQCIQCSAGTPAPSHFFPFQKVDHLASAARKRTSSSTRHFDDDNGDDEPSLEFRFWSQRYYFSDLHFCGGGCPIFLVLGGESAIEPDTTGLLYPFVTDHLAKRFGAYVLQPEHRFYGKSQPISRQEIDDARLKGKPDPRIQLLTSEQALNDALYLLEWLQERKLGDSVGMNVTVPSSSSLLAECSPDRLSHKYCPVIAVGGSYSGFLSAMARILFPSKVEMSYAASAPMKFYSQEINQSTPTVTAYYDHITQVTEKAFPNCASAVKHTLADLAKYFRSSNGSFDRVAASEVIGLCNETLPSYIQDTETFLDEVFMMVGYTFANLNMAFYPPNDKSGLSRACQIFLSLHHSALERFKTFMQYFLGGEDECVDMYRQLPTGPNATVSGGDWSGVGTGASGESWDFQTCTLLVEAISFGPSSMFPERPWSLENWMQSHCHARFGVHPKPHVLVKRWGFDDIAATGTSRILFTNGLNDGWSVSGIQQNLSDSIVSLNFPNGAHHSELSGQGPSDQDTEDIRKGFYQITEILAKWLSQLPSRQLTEDSM